MAFSYYPMNIKIFTFLLITFISNTAGALEIPFLKPYKELLNDYTEETVLEGIPTTAINYKEWQKDPRHKEAIELLTSDAIGNYLSREQQISFWLNAYNILVIDLIVREVPNGSIQNLGGIVSDPWNEYSWVIDGLEYNLNYIQHQILRPLGEVRVNFALTCGAISCPSLKRTPYWPDRLYTQLEKQTQRFINNEKKAFVVVEKAPENGERIKSRDKAYISEIFLWHQKELEGGSVNRFIQRYKPLDNIEIEDYLDFNWNLNAKVENFPSKALRNPITKTVRKSITD